MLLKNLLFFVAISTLIFTCGPSPSAQLEANKDLVNRFTIALNAADWDALDALLTEDFKRHCQATPNVKVKSRNEFRELQKNFLTSMPDQKVVNEMLIAEGNYVAAYSTYSGTLTGPMGDFPATGKSVAMKFIGIFRIENNQIAEIWVEWDNINMLTQLGL
jgi:steroid delta-isomerase-like uncharacterized protein